jgi:diguanylate cyclase (GGDEF)-like protein
MYERLTLGVLATLVRMMRADVDGAIWLVQDDGEARFYEACAHESCRVVSAYGGVLELLDSIEALGIEGVVAVVRGASPLEPPRQNVFWPSVGDAASLLLLSAGYDRAMADSCGRPWLEAARKAVGSLQSRAVKIARQLQMLRLACDGFGVRRLDADQTKGLIRWDTLDLAWDKVRTALTGIPDGDLRAVKGLPESAQIERAHMRECVGEDAVGVLAAATEHFRPRGIRADKAISTEDLMGLLRAAFRPEEIEGDEIFRQMSRWELSHRSYPLLRRWRTLDPLGVVWDQRYWEPDLERVIGPSSIWDRAAIFEMDLDNFKNVNDTLGHPAGDEAIRRYSSIVKGLLADAGEVYRRGGDELVAIAPELERERACQLAEAIRATIESEFRDWGAQRGLANPPTVSIGVVSSESGQSVDQVVELLTNAHLRAKKKGKNQVVCAP